MRSTEESGGRYHARQTPGIRVGEARTKAVPEVHTKIATGWDRARAPRAGSRNRPWVRVVECTTTRVRDGVGIVRPRWIAGRHLSIRAGTRRRSSWKCIEVGGCVTDGCRTRRMQSRRADVGMRGRRSSAGTMIVATMMPGGGRERTGALTRRERSRARMTRHSMARDRVRPSREVVYSSRLCNLLSAVLIAPR